MKIKKEYIFLFAIIVALILYLVMQRQTGTHVEMPDIPQIASTEITKVEIQRPKNTIVLTRKDNDWEIGPNKYKADTNTVNQILNIIGSLSLTALVSKSKNYERYDLNSGNKISVKAWTGETLRREFNIGKPAPSYRHTFVTMPDNNNVYHALNNFRYTFEKSLDDMRDKTILSFDKKDIHHIAIKSDQTTASYQRRSQEKSDEENQNKAAETGALEQWFDAEDQIVDPSIIDPLLNTLSNLKCASYIADQTKDDFQNPIYTVTLKGKEAYTLSIFHKIRPEDKEYPSISSHNEYAFMLPTWVTDKIIKKPEHTDN